MNHLLLKAPFPYFGGKSRVASLIWDKFGAVPNYVEPFAGSLAVLLARPHAPKIETVNDADCFIANFWRALAAEPEMVGNYCNLPVIECDLHARHKWLLGLAGGETGAERQEWRRRMAQDPHFYDAKIAGWWVWGKCAWIGSGWCKSEQLWNGEPQTSPTQQLPQLAQAGSGVHANARAGRSLYESLFALSDRLRRVRVCCGDWERVMGPCATDRHGLTGILLDPPYSLKERAGGLYGVDSGTVAADVSEWCKLNGENHLLRVCLCGYAGEHDALEAAGWQCVAWKTPGGYGSIGNGRGRENAGRERLWFSPHCLKTNLFDMVEIEQAK